MKKKIQTSKKSKKWNFKKIQKLIFSRIDIADSAMLVTELVTN